LRICGLKLALVGHRKTRKTCRETASFYKIDIEGDGRTGGNKNRDSCTLTSKIRVLATEGTGLLLGK